MTNSTNAVDQVQKLQLTPELLYLRDKVRTAWISGDANFREYYDSAVLELIGVSTFEELVD